MQNKNNIPLRIISLGGLGEFGMNTLVLEYGEQLVVIDAGIMFPDEETPGVDLIVPDITYLLENKDKIEGIVLTHGHLDHIGGLAYILEKIDVPVYGSKLTLEFAKSRLKEFNLLSQTKLNEISSEDRLNLGPFEFEFFDTSHSVPDTLGMAIRTPVGMIVHSGDFKFDQTPVDGKRTDVHKLAKFGHEEVLLLLSDSTNSERPGYTPSERSIYSSLDNIFYSAEKRIFFSTFASSIHRIQQCIEISIEHERKVAITGRSMRENIKIASELGYLRVPEEHIISEKNVMDYPADEVVVLSTGSQGEPRSAMSRLALDEHARMKVEPADTVIISARIIPGHEKIVGKMIDHFFRRGADVVYEGLSEVHASGHGSREDLKWMINLVQPKFFIPIHGGHRKLVYHAHLAGQTGIPEENILIAEDGEVIELTADSCKVVDEVTAGRVFVDGTIDSGIEDIVLHDRQQLSQDGMVIPIVVLDGHTGKLIAGPDIVSRGVVYVDASEKLLNEAKDVVIKSLEKLNLEEKNDTAIVQDEIRTELRKFFSKRLSRRPIVLSVLMRV